MEKARSFLAQPGGFRDAATPSDQLWMTARRSRQQEGSQPVTRTLKLFLSQSLSLTECVSGKSVKRTTQSLLFTQSVKSDRDAVAVFCD